MRHRKMTDGDGRVHPTPRADDLRPLEANLDYVYAENHPEFAQSLLEPENSYEIAAREAREHERRYGQGPTSAAAALIWAQKRLGGRR
jgi:hypothetical protein